MTNCLLTLFGATDGANLTGTFSLLGSPLQASVSSITIPAGLNLKIWARRGNGAACIVNYQLSQVTPVSYSTVSSQDLSSAGEVDLEKRRPILFRGNNGNDTVRIQWSQTVAAVSNVEFELEFSEQEGIID